MAETDAERVVYYEDFAPTKTAKENVKNAVDGETKVNMVCVGVESDTAAQTTKTSVKRQRTLMDMFGPSDVSTKKPKLAQSASSSSQALNSIPFSLSAFQDSLTDEGKNLLSLECETMGKSWLKVLKDEIQKPYFLSLKKYLWEEGVKGANDTPKSCKIYPPPKDIYSWSNYTPLGKVKVVIVGQDPYFSARQAHGLCFSVPHGIAVPPSLVNIYTEIKSEYPEFVLPKHGNLTMWANNGVLLLNTCLTVKAGNPGSHSNKGWETFTEQVLKVVDKYGGANLPTNGTSTRVGFGRGVVFIAWGSWAQKRVAGLDKHKHLILTSAVSYPPASATPLMQIKSEHGNGHFKMANDWLEEKYGAGGKVDWCKLDESPN